MSSLEDAGFQALTKKGAEDADESKILDNVGAFGANMTVVGLGTMLLSRHAEAGRDIAKLGAILAAGGYGTRLLATGELPKVGGDEVMETNWDKAARIVPFGILAVTVPLSLYIMIRR